MKQKIADFFRGMRPLEVTEYLILAATAMVSSWSWEIALKLFELLIVVVVVRIIATRHIGNPSLSKMMRWALLMMVAYYLWQGVTLFWTDNLVEGWDFMLTRLPLIILPLALLCADTSYITPLRRRGILYAFTTSLLVKFFYCLIAALLSGKGIKFESSFDWVHHTYMAMYFVMALGFLYGEWVNHRNELHKGVKIAMPFAVIVIIMHMLLVASRTGIIGVAFIFLCIVLHQTVRLHNIKQGLTILVCGLALCCAAYFALPKSARRITQTVEDIRNIDKGDIRVDIYKCALYAGIDNLPFGVGVGDGQEILEKYYMENGHEWPDLNTHNIFLDSLLSMGLPGLLLLLALLALPTIDGYRRRDFDLITLMFAITLGGLFESVISRQIGLMFIVPMWYAIASSGRDPHTDLKDSQ